MSACAGNRGWGYADSNDGRREVLPRVSSGAGPGWAVLSACVCVAEGAAGYDLCNDPNAPYVPLEWASGKSSALQ